jgi:glycosyltransferase involved in cell wall biosynthesis
MKITVVTPYYREPFKTLHKCFSSVQAQQHPDVHHVMVSDGYPHDVYGCTHIKIPASGDFGNTPRGVGVLVAAAQGAEAISLLDADCWFEPEHLKLMALAMQEHDAQVVTCPRMLWRLDGTQMGVDRECDGNHWNDTNCFLVRKDAFRLFDGWMWGEKPNAGIQDRIFWHRVKTSGAKIVRMTEATSNYLTAFAFHYLQNGEKPPPLAKVLVNTNKGWKNMPYWEKYDQVRSPYASLAEQ